LTGEGAGWQAKFRATPPAAPPSTQPHPHIPYAHPSCPHPPARQGRCARHASSTTYYDAHTGYAAQARGRARGGPHGHTAAHTRAGRRRRTTRYAPPQTTDTTTAHRVAKDRTAGAASNEQRGIPAAKCPSRSDCATHRAHIEPPQGAQGTVGLTYGRQRQAGRGSGRQRAHLLISLTV
jgi:hypothetical protein